MQHYAKKKEKTRGSLHTNERQPHMAHISASDPIVILSSARTPMGSMQGALADVSATDLGAVAVKAAVERAGVAPADIERLYMGCVLPAGLGQAPAWRKGWPAPFRSGDHGKQGLRLWHADGDHGRRGSGLRLG